METFVSHSPEETQDIGSKLGASLKGGEVVLLNGELGAGKTTFSKGVALGLDIKQTITSPTFTLLNDYSGGRLRLLHFDMYRLPKGADVEMGFDEYYGKEDTVCLIEWSAAEEYFGATVIKVDFGYSGENTREITITRI